MSIRQSRFRSLGLLAIPLCACLVSARARAEEPKAPAPSSVGPAATPGDTPAPSAEAPATPNPALAEASQRYERGLALYGDAEYVLALVEFERAYQLAPDYRVLYNIGQVRIQLGRYARALEALSAYLEQGGQAISPERVASVNKDLDMLAERTAKLTVITNEPSANISLDGVVIGVTPLPGPLVVDAGEHNVGARKVGFYDKFSAVTLAGRDDVKVELDLVHVKEADRPKVVVEHRTERIVPAKSDRTLVWVGWAATGTLGITAGVFGYLGVTKANELESMRTDYGVTPEQLQDAKSSARTLFMVADIAGASAVVLGGVSLYLTLSSSDRAVERVTRGAPGNWRLGINPKGLRLTAHF